MCKYMGGLGKLRKPSGSQKYASTATVVPVLLVVSEATISSRKFPWVGAQFLMKPWTMRSRLT